MSKKALTNGNQVSRLHRLMATDLVKGFSLAIDGGANIGAWTIVMAEYFGKVIAFEPVPETFGLLVENVKAHRNVECRNQALMDKAGTIKIKIPDYNDKHQQATGEIVNKDLRARYVEWDNTGDIAAITIDSLNLASCDLIKLDLEGAEPLALDGAVETIKKFRPVLVVEIKRHSRRFKVHPTLVHEKVIKMGYRQSFRDGHDRFYVSDK